MVTGLLYEKFFGHRIDTRTHALVPSFQDFPELKRKPIEITSDREQLLRGFIYSKQAESVHLGLVIIAPGFGAISEDYLEVIASFASEGFSVLSYNNTGCFSSEGKSVRGLPQASLDLLATINYVKDSQELNHLPLFIYGHNWGGYAACAILNNETRIDGLAVLAGFNLTSDLIFEHLKGEYGNWARFLQPYLAFYEFAKFGPIASKTAINGINNFQGKVLLVHGSEDEAINLDGSTLAPLTVIAIPKSDHDLIFSDDALQYIKNKNLELEHLLKIYGDMNRLPGIVQSNFYKSIDKIKARELNREVMTGTIDFFLEIIKNETTR